MVIHTFAFMLKSQVPQKVTVGAERIEEYIPLLKDIRVAVVANQTSLIQQTHLVDSLVALGINIRKIFTPEHGFRGEIDDGEIVQDGIDANTGLPIVSLYGKNRKPQGNDLEDIDLIIFDIQEVGVRYYTFISTMYYVMQACAEYGKIFMVLDRPNPNGFYIDGPLLELKYSSFVGLHPVPLVHGMTIAEYAQMINGEGWLGHDLFCDIIPVICTGYNHQVKYRLPVKPSPNLPTMNSVYLYPSLGLFEGTAMSVGRGTDFPFEVFGHPELENCTFAFIPEPRPGAAMHPKLEGEKCFGIDLREKRKLGSERPGKINLEWLLFAYKNYPAKKEFFNSYFEKLAGTDQLRKQIQKGRSEEEIRQSWQENLEEFRVLRKKYLLYPDFE